MSLNHVAARGVWQTSVPLSRKITGHPERYSILRLRLSLDGGRSPPAPMMMEQAIYAMRFVIKVSAVVHPKNIDSKFCRRINISHEVHLHLMILCIALSMSPSAKFHLF
jgi:hypothetical protein